MAKCIYTIQFENPPEVPPLVDYILPPAPINQRLPIACQPYDPTWPVHDLGQMNVQCPSCRALHWDAEHLKSSSAANPKFGKCCHSGKFTLPPLQPPPRELYNLLTSQDHVGKEFRNHICNYNSALAMTSVGRKLDETVNQGGRGPYVFKLHGELIHQVGSLLPSEEDQPKYAQLYVYDPEQALEFRMANRWNVNLD